LAWGMSCRGSAGPCEPRRPAHLGTARPRRRSVARPRRRQDVPPFGRGAKTLTAIRLEQLVWRADGTLWGSFPAARPILSRGAGLPSPPDRPGNWLMSVLPCGGRRCLHGLISIHRIRAATNTRRSDASTHGHVPLETRIRRWRWSTSSPDLYVRLRTRSHALRGRADLCVLRGPLL
jgi:hypothetical protein